MDRWPEIERLLDQVLDLAPEQRAAFLERTCATDPELRGAVERLLRATESADSLLGVPAAEYAAPLVSWVAGRQELALGTPFGAYEVTRQLGQGGMATVYLAQDHKHHRAVAIKVLHPELAVAVGPERFLREIEIAAALHHPHILPLYDSGVTDGLLYYAMPYIEGESLRQRLMREQHLPIEDAIRIVQEVAGALDYAHRQGVVHRDIKPENILLQDGQAIVADFGIARAIDAAGAERLTAPGPGIGTPAYMSPEQASSDAVIDGRTDIYALGCVLNEMLAGQPPFTGRSRQQILARHAVDPVPSLHTVRQTVPPALERAVNCALAKLPADRFATAAQFAEALDGMVGAATPHRPRFGLRRRGLVLGVAATVFLTAGIGYLLRRPSGSAGSNPGMVAILPFRTAGASPELAWLGEGLVDLLSIKLTGEGDLRAADPTSVLNAWRRVTELRSKELTLDAAIELAHRLGAGRMIDGNVVGTPGHLTLTASLLTTHGGRSLVRASVEGPVDSLSLLVDRLAARLLTLDAGVDVSRLSSISASLPAIRAFLLGRAAFRKGNLDEAFRHYREATLLDSTFALGVLELVHASRMVGANEDFERGRGLALAGRNRLGPGDRALLDVWTSPILPGPEWLQRWQAAADAYPDRAETWYGLGETYYHNGMLLGLEDPLHLAAEAFQRGWAIDSANGAESPPSERSPIFAEPLTHMVAIAQIKGDTASVRRLVALGLAADSTSRGGWYLRWHRAVAQGDSARHAFWADSLRIDPTALGLVSDFMTWTGLGSQDLPRAMRLDTRKMEAGHPGAVASVRAAALMNGGRPREALRLLHRDETTTEDLLGPIREALYWGGDTTAAAEAAQRLAQFAAGAARIGNAGRRQVVALCALAAWHAAHADYGYVEAVIPRLRGASITGLSSNDSIEVPQYTALCTVLLEATRASALRLPDARARLAQADAAARTYTFWSPCCGANLVIARVAEAQGDLALALRAVRRRGGEFGRLPYYLSTFLREEGRLAALTGDTAGAIRAYQHYLALRPDPEPEVKPEVERVREELARLLGERPSNR